MNLTTGNGSGPLNVCCYCGSKICTEYKDLYDYDWNLDGTVTRESCNRWCRICLDMNIATAARATRSSVSRINNPNIARDDQDDLLKH